MAEDLRLNIVSTADSKGFERAAKDISDAKAEAKGLSDTWAKLGDNAEDLEQDVDGATKSVKEHGEQVRILRAEYEKTTKRIAELDAQLIASGNAKGVKKDLREQRAWLSELQKVAKEIQRTSGIRFSLGDGEPVMSGVLEGILGGLPQLGGIPPQLLAGGAVLGAALAPPIAAAVSGAVLGTAGAGGVIGGALLASRDPEVKAAFASLGAMAMRELEPAGEAFKGPVIEAIGEIKESLKGANLSGVLGGAAPLTGPFARGLTGFATGITGSLGKAFSRAGPLFEVWEKEMPQLGDSIGSAMESISATSPAAARGLEDFFDITETGIQTLGDATAGLILLNDLMGGLGDLLPEATPEMKSGLAFGWIGTLGAAARVAAPDVSAVGERLQTAAERAKAFGVEMTDSTIALKDFHSAALGTLDANIAYEQSLDDLAEALKENGRSLDINGQKGRDNMIAFKGAVEDAIAVRDDLASQGKIEEANAAYKRMTDRIRDVMIQAGFTKAEIDKLIKPYEFTITARLVTKGSFPRYVSGNLSQGALDADSLGRRASGGPVMAGRPYLVGEQGPELVVPQRNGFVIPNGGGFGSGGGYSDARPVVITVVGSHDDQAMIERISSAVQARGGRLAVLGLKGS